MPRDHENARVYQAAGAIARHALARVVGMPLGKIPKYIDRNEGTIHRYVAELVRRGWLESDGRRYARRYMLTPAGQRVVAAIQKDGHR